MANLISRFFQSFAAAAPVPSLDPLDGEFNQLVGGNGVLNGGNPGFRILIRSSDAAQPPIDSDQIGIGPLASWKKNGSQLVWIDATGEIRSEVGTGIAPIYVLSTTMCPNLNAAMVGGHPASDFLIAGVHRTWWSMNWFIQDPSTFPANSFNFAQKVLVPDSGNTFVATQVRAICNTGNNAGAFVFEVRKHPFSVQNAQTTLGAINFNPAAGAAVGAGVIASVSTAVQILNNGDYVYPVLTAISAPQQRDLSISLEGYQTTTPG